MTNTPQKQKLWKMPHMLKIYEALGVIADNRIKIYGTQAKVFSSSWNKYYDVKVDWDQKKSMSNDNASYYNETLGYPVIAFLIKKEFLLCDWKYIHLFWNIYWKDINQKNNNNFDQTKQEIDAMLQWQIRDFEKFEHSIQAMYRTLKENPFSFLWEKTLPPTGY